METPDGCVGKGRGHAGFDGFFVVARTRRRERDTVTRPCPDGSTTDGGRWSRLATVASLSSLRRPTPTRPPARGRGRLSTGVISASGNQPAERRVMKSTAVLVGV